MAIKYEQDDGAGKPAKKEVGGKTYVAEEPPGESAHTESVFPFAKPKRPEKKPRGTK